MEVTVVLIVLVLSTATSYFIDLFRMNRGKCLKCGNRMILMHKTEHGREYKCLFGHQLYVAWDVKEEMKIPQKMRRK
jgi:hypothetical protein